MDETLEPGQSGIFGLLQGEAMSVKPEGFDALHIRGGKMHRLRENVEKWIPRGIGNGKPEE
jgi:lysine 2,3-aminomutase